MPLLAVFGAAPQIGLRINAAHLHPDQIADRKRRRQRDAKTPVAVEQRRILTVELQTLFVRDEHRHARAVLAVVEDLLGFVIGRIEINLRFAIDLALARLHVVAINGGRRDKAGESVKGFGVFALPAESNGRADAGQLDLTDELSVQVEELDLRARVFQVGSDEMVADQAHAFERFGRLRHKLFPARAIRIARVNRNDAASRGVQVGAEPEDRAIVADEVVRGFEFVDQFDDLGVRRLKVFKKNSVSRISSLPDIDDQIAPVFGDLAAESPFLLVFALVDQNVFGLRRAEAVVEELLIVVRVFELSLLVRLVVAAIEKSFAVRRPRRAGELHPFNRIGEVIPSLDLASLPFLPIRTGGRKPISQVFAVLADRVARQRDRAVSGKFVRIEQHARFAVERFQRVEHVLILEAVVFEIEITATLFERRSVFLVVPELGQSLLDLGAFGDLIEKTEGELVLSLDPCARIG